MAIKPQVLYHNISLFLMDKAAYWSSAAEAQWKQRLDHSTEYPTIMKEIIVNI